MKLVGVIFEDFVNYKVPCMTLEFPQCSFKCDKECGKPVCQNSALAYAKQIDVNISDIIFKYLNNPITKAVCCQGLEPFDSWVDLSLFIKEFRELSNDDIVIYTGYKKDELSSKIDIIKKWGNIIIKFGRYIPDQISHKDPVLEVMLASDNQYAERL